MKKDPVPTEVVRDPTAQGRADRGGDHDGHSIDSETHIPLFSRERICQDRLFARPKAAAAQALHNSKYDEHGKAGGHTAKHGTQSKENYAGHVKALAPDSG